jgi:hypothetical protein
MTKREDNKNRETNSVDHSNWQKYLWTGWFGIAWERKKQIWHLSRVDKTEHKQSQRAGENGHRFMN